MPWDKNPILAPLAAATGQAKSSNVAIQGLSMAIVTSLPYSISITCSAFQPPCPCLLVTSLVACMLMSLTAGLSLWYVDSRGL